MTLDLSPRVYWMLATAIIGAYVLLWWMNFHHVYGWCNDERVVYAKGMLTVRDWKQAFRNFLNALQPYFFVISYLPLKLDISLHSYPLSGLDAETGHYRWFLLYAVLSTGSYWWPGLGLPPG